MQFLGRGTANAGKRKPSARSGQENFNPNSKSAAQDVAEIDAELEDADCLHEKGTRAGIDTTENALKKQRLESAASFAAIQQSMVLLANVS